VCARRGETLTARVCFIRITSPVVPAFSKRARRAFLIDPNFYYMHNQPKSDKVAWCHAGFAPS